MVQPNTSFQIYFRLTYLKCFSLLIFIGVLLFWKDIALMSLEQVLYSFLFVYDKNKCMCPNDSISNSSHWLCQHLLPILLKKKTTASRSIMSTAKDLSSKKLKYSCCTILLVFQVYYIMIWYLHTLWSVHHDKSSSHLSPCKVITVILTTFLMLCIITVYLCDVYYITGCVDLLISFSCFLSPTQSPLPLGNDPFFSVFVLFYSFFLIPHISEMMWYLSFCVWLISLSIILSRSIHVVTNGKISVFMAE